VADINLGYINSDVPLAAYLLCTEEASTLSEEPDARIQLLHFARMKGRGRQGMAAVRDTADTAVLLVAEFSNGTCGIGFVGGLRGGKTLSAVKKSCAMSYYSVGHEICHNVGCDHDPEHANVRPYPYGTGHFIESNDAEEDEGDDNDDDEDEEGYRTIMSYKKKGHRTRINFYSNPNVILSDIGAPTGTELSNNALVLIKNRFRLAAVGDESSPHCRISDDSSETDSDENAADDDKSSSVEYDVYEADDEMESSEDASYISPQEDSHAFS
jgi:Metallo-peptidase family M12